MIKVAFKNIDKSDYKAIYNKFARWYFTGMRYYDRSQVVGSEQINLQFEVNPNSIGKCNQIECLQDTFNEEIADKSMNTRIEETFKEAL